MNSNGPATRRWAVVLCAVMFSSLLAAGGAAQLPPLVGAEKMSPALRALVETERAFAQTSIDRGMKEAFLTFAADDGIIFRRTPVNAKEAWRQTNPAPTALLTWYPLYADISRAGDLGYTTGPYEIREKPTDKEAAGHGHFVTLWRKQADGTFKFVLDFGSRHAAPPAGGDLTVVFPAAASKSGGNVKDVDADTARRSLLDAERALAKDAATEGPAGGLLAHAADDIRFYRQNAFPVVGRERTRAALAAPPAGSVTWQPAKAEVARSGDLGYVYGTYTLTTKDAAGKPPEQGNYMRIWKRHGNRWQVVLDITNPIPPPRPQQ